MAATRLIPLHIGKGRTLAQCLADRTDYAQNPEKTEKGQLVTSYKCDPMTADEEFLLTKRLYEHKTGRRQQNNVIAYQIRQSFKPGEITPEEANRVGRELALRFTKGKYAFIVATHTDQAHIHNHIIFNSTSLDGTRKFRDFHLSWLALSRLSDQICMEHQLSVIEQKPYSDRTKRNEYPKEKSFRDEIREAIDAALLQKPKDFDELVRLLREAGYEYRPGNQPALRGQGQKRFIRFRSLGEGYSAEELSAVIEGQTEHKQRKWKSARSGAGSGKSTAHSHGKSELSFLIDIQSRMQEGKGAGYAQWAKVFNLKQMAQALVFMKEHNVSSYENLETRTNAINGKCDALLTSVKEDEKRLQEIAVLKKHIVNYAKSKDVYAEYRKLKSEMHDWQIALRIVQTIQNEDTPEQPQQSRGQESRGHASKR